MKRIVVLLLTGLLAAGVAIAIVPIDQPKWHGWHGRCPWEPITPHNCTVEA